MGAALLHDRKVGFVRSFLSGGYEFFRYASPLLVKEFSDAVDSGDQVTAEKGDFDWYLEVLSVDKQMRGRGVGRWLVSQVLPDYVAKRGGRAYGFVTSTEENARFYLNGGCELLDRFDILCAMKHVRSDWSFERRASVFDERSNGSIALCSGPSSAA